MHLPRFVLAVAPGIVLAACLILAPASVRAEPEGVVFQWSRDASASTCPAQGAMVEEIGRRLGTMPFSREGRRSLEGFAERRDGAYRVRLVLRDASGAVAWTRELASRDADCAPLSQAAALAVAALLAPEVEAARAEGPADAADGSDAAAEADAREASAPALTHTPARSEDASAPTAKMLFAEGAAAATTLELGTVVAGGLLPSPSAGLDIGASRGLRGPLRLELGAMWLSSVRTESGRFSFGLVAARTGLCGESAGTRFSVALCARALVGVVHGTVYQISPSRPGDRAWIALSAGPQMRVRLAGPLLLSAGGGVLASVLRYEFVSAVGARDFVVFEQPIVGVEAHLGLSLAFP